MTDRPAFRRLGRIAEKWLSLAEKRRDDLAELYRSGHWKRYYTGDTLIARTREVADICDRWTMILEQHRRVLAKPDAPAIDRNAA